jgi:TRAP-type transport system periplasmic protein
MRSMKVLVAVFMVIGAANWAQAEPMEIKLGHINQPGSLIDIECQEYAKRANAKLGDMAKVVVYNAAQLGNDKDQVNRLKLGTQHIALPSSLMTSILSIAGVYDMPYLISDRKHADLARDKVILPAINPPLEKKGYKVIAMWENGFRQITNSSKPVNTPADLKGIKLRVPEGEWRFKMFQAYGANPTPMTFNEVFVALQTKVIDDQENPLAQIYSAKLQEVQKYLSITNHVYTPMYVTVGVQKWNTLPAGVRKVLEEVAVEIQDFSAQTGEAMDKDIIEKLKIAMVVNVADREAFIKASAPIYEEFGQKVPEGKQLVADVLALGK